MKIIDTTNLPFLLQTLKEEKYFFNDSILTPIEEKLISIETTVNNNAEQLDILINKSSLEIFPLQEVGEDVTGYQFDLYSDSSTDGTNKKIIASGVLPYDTLSSGDSQEVINNVRKNI